MTNSKTRLDFKSLFKKNQSALEESESVAVLGDEAAYPKPCASHESRPFLNPLDFDDKLDGEDDFELSARLVGYP